MKANEYYISYPVLQVRPYGLLAYERREYHYRPKRETTRRTQATTKTTQFGSQEGNEQYTGSLTPYARKRLKRAIQLLVASALEKEAPNFKTGKTFKFKVNFITLTLPCPQGDVSDKDLKKYCLDNWIKRARRKYKLNNYVWRAERQKNNNLHFHLITDTWIHYEKIRNDWNELLNHFHYIDNFKAKHNHTNPNSTDVHAVWKVKNLTQYFIKYMTKGEKEGQKVEGKLWDCSKALKTKHNCEQLMESEVLQVWNEVREDPEVITKDDALYSLAFLNPSQFNQYVKGNLLTAWNEYLTRIRDGNHST